MKSTRDWSQDTASDQEELTSQQYERPIHWLVLDVAGALSFIGGVLSIVSCFVFPMTNAEHGWLLLVGVVCLVNGVWFVGAAQVIDFIGRTAHCSERLCDLVKSRIGQQISKIDRRVQIVSRILEYMEVERSSEIADDLVGVEDDPVSKQFEEDAKQLFAKARQHAKAAKTGDALSILEEITRRFPNTLAAKHARFRLQINGELP